MPGLVAAWLDCVTVRHDQICVGSLQCAVSKSDVDSMPTLYSIDKFTEQPTSFCVLYAMEYANACDTMFLCQSFLEMMPRGGTFSSLMGPATFSCLKTMLCVCGP